MHSSSDHEGAHDQLQCSRHYAVCNMAEGMHTCCTCMKPPHSVLLAQMFQAHFADIADMTSATVNMLCTLIVLREHPINLRRIYLDSILIISAELLPADLGLQVCFVSRGKAIPLDAVHQGLYGSHRLNCCACYLQEQLRQKKEYDIVIGERDILGTQLIRRNDELALLYEKIKIQQSTLNKGQLQYRDRCALAYS